MISSLGGGWLRPYSWATKRDFFAASLDRIRFMNYAYLRVNSSENSENKKGSVETLPASHAGQSQCHAPNYLQRDFILGNS